MPTIGETLRTAREKRGITLEVAAKSLKMKMDRLRDLEEGCFDHFPAQVYTRSFLRHYSTYLGLNETEVIDQFTRENPPPPRKPIFEITEEQRSQSTFQSQRIPGEAAESLTTTGKAVILGGILFLIFVIVCVLWGLRSRSNHVDREFKHMKEHRDAAFVPESPASENFTPQSVTTLSLSTTNAPVSWGNMSNIFLGPRAP